MSKIVNVRRDVTDKYYRYKMPLLECKIEGRGNGIKTVFPNMADVARALNRPASYPTKFFGAELGAQATFNDETERYICNGAHDTEHMRTLLDKFIKMYVLCASCLNPETELFIAKGDIIKADCKACGHQGESNNRHKLATFVVKNPPAKASKKSKKKAAAGADSIAGQPAQIDDDEQDQDALTKEINEGAAALMSEKEAAALIAQREAEDDWGEDTSAEAVAARMKALGVSDDLVRGDDDDDEEELDKYGRFAQQAAEDKLSNAEIFKQAEDVGKAYKVLAALPVHLFSDEIVQELPARLPLFAKMTTDAKEAKALLGGIEAYFGNHMDNLNLVGKVLLQFYEADIIDEELLLDWGAHVSSKYVPKDKSKKIRKAAEPFIQWLQQASEEEDSDDE